MGELARYLKSRNPKKYQGADDATLEYHLQQQMLDNAADTKTISAVRRNAGLTPDDISDDELRYHLSTGTAPTSQKKPAINHTNPEQAYQDALDSKSNFQMGQSQALEQQRLHNEEALNENSPTSFTEQQRQRAMEMVPPTSAVEPEPGASAVPEHLRPPAQKHRVFQDYNQELVPFAKRLDPTFGTRAPAFRGVKWVDGTNGKPVPMTQFEPMGPGEGAKVKMMMPGFWDTRASLVSKGNPDATSPKELLNADTGQILASMDSQGSFPQSDVPGWNLLSRVGGPGSNVEQAAVSALRGAYDPTTGKGGAGAMQLTEPTELTQESGVEPPLGVRTGVGLPEYGAAMGEQLARGASANPEARAMMLGAARGGTALQRGFNAMREVRAKEDLADAERGMAPKAPGMNRGDLATGGGDSVSGRTQVWSPRAGRFLDVPGSPPAPESFAARIAAQRTKLAEAQQAQTDANDFTGYLNGAEQDPALASAITAQGGRQAGRTAGSGAQQLLNLPSEVGAGMAALRAGWNRADKLRAAVGGSTLAQAVAPALSNQPNIWGVRDAAKPVLQEAKQTVSNMADVGRLRAGMDTQGALDAVYSAHGVPEAARAPMEQATREAWGDPALRQQLTDGPQGAVFKDIFDAMQPRHQQYGHAAAGLEEPYNPLHQMVGDITKEGGGVETSALRRGAPEGQEMQDLFANQGKMLPPQDVAGAPGVSALSPETQQAMRPIVSKRVSQFKEQMTQQLVEGGMSVPRAEKLVSQRLDKGLAQNTADIYGDILTSTGAPVRKAADNIAAEWTAFSKASGGAMTNDLGQAAYEPAESFLARHADAARTAKLNTYAQGMGRTVAPQSMVDELARGGSVIVHVKGQPLPVSGLPADLVVEVNNAAAGSMNGWKVPRADVMAAKDIFDPTGSKLRQTARDIDRVLGLSQTKAMLTTARFGFAPRNNTGDVFKASADEGAFNVFGHENMRDWGRISNATIGEGPDGQLLEAILEQQGLGHGLKQEAYKSLEAGRGGTLPSLIAEKTGSERLQRIAQGYQDARDAALQRVGSVAHGYDKGMTRVAFGGSGINPMFTADDNIRALLTVAKIKRMERIGMTRREAVRLAARETNGLLVNYADKAPLTEVMEKTGAVPFWQYYMGTAAALPKLFAKNPRAYGNVYNLMRDVEGVDEAQHGGAMDPRIKTVQDQVALNPQIHGWGRLLTPRVETQASEFAPLLETAAGYGNGAGQFAGSLPTALHEGLTGANWNGQPVLPIAKERLQQAPYDVGVGPLRIPAGRLLGSAEMTAEDTHRPDTGQSAKEMLGRSGVAGNLAYALARPWTPELLLAPLKTAGQVGYSPLQRTAEDQHMALRRALLKATSGVDMGSTSASGNKMSMEKQHPAGKTLEEIMRKLQKRGRAAEPPEVEP